MLFPHPIAGDVLLKVTFPVCLFFVFLYGRAFFPGPKWVAFTPWRGGVCAVGWVGAGGVFGVGGGVRGVLGAGRGGGVGGGRGVGGPKKKSANPLHFFRVSSPLFNFFSFREGAPVPHLFSFCESGLQSQINSPSLETPCALVFRRSRDNINLAYVRFSNPQVLGVKEDFPKSFSSFHLFFLMTRRLFYPFPRFLPKTTRALHPPFCSYSIFCFSRIFSA